MLYRVLFLTDDASDSLSFEGLAGDTHSAELKGWEGLMQLTDNWGAYSVFDCYVCDATEDEVAQAYAMLNAVTDGAYL